MNVLIEYLPTKVNQGSWLTSYTLDELKNRIDGQKIVLPICSLGTPFEHIQQLGDFVLPPLYHEALDESLKTSIIAQIRRCFPFLQGTRRAIDSATSVQVVELPREAHRLSMKTRVLSFSVDTAVEQHGPHLPLATDTIQSYLVLSRLAREIDGFAVGPPVEYGHLTWGLPFGMSIDITPPLLARYVTGFANAIQTWMEPETMYVVDVHGSIVHRTAIEDGLRASSVKQYAFRWLYDPIVEFAGDRGDQHAGGVETAMVELASPDLVDRRWWPDRIDELAAQQMDLDTAVELTPDLNQFVKHAESQSLNGIVGDVYNYHKVDASTMLARMLEVTRADLKQLTGA
ncbi:MAG: creatininase family protein [Planctomycetaceae bacterium]|nr:creatininase family protein [Planctomycetales bacterium]MCB9920744.1 creatininase family protein [Planctomycetaceae bacterium]